MNTPGASHPSGIIESFTGELITLRDQTLMRMAEDIAHGNTLPYDFAGKWVFFAGPTPGFKEGKGSIGPTTARRMAQFFPMLLELKIAALVAKGPMDEASAALFKHKGVRYLQAVGGAGAYYGSRVDTIEAIAYTDLGPEAVYRLMVHDFTLFVSIDDTGNTRM